MFYDFRTKAWRAVPVKTDAMGITSMQGFVCGGHLNLTGISAPALLAGEPGNSPPNITPIFNETGTIAGERISP